MADACILRPAVLRSWQPGVALGTHRAQESIWYVSNLIFTPCDLSWFQEMDLSTASTREHLPHCCFMAPEASMGQTVLPHRAEVGWAAHDKWPAMGARERPALSFSSQDIRAAGARGGFLGEQRWGKQGLAGAPRREWPEWSVGGPPLQLLGVRHVYPSRAFAAKSVELPGRAVHK